MKASSERVGPGHKLPTTHRPLGTAVLSLSLVLVGPLLLGSCARPQPVTKTVPGPTVTVTVPGPTETATKTATVTITKTAKVRVTTTVAPSPSTAPAAAETFASAPDDFDRAYAINVAGDIIEEIKTVDYRLNDGIAVSSALSLLSGDYGRLAGAGTPPGVVAKDYHARLSTLESFAATAADEYDANPTEGHARYAVVRKETGPLFQQLNSAMGTGFRLP